MLTICIISYYFAGYHPINAILLIKYENRRGNTSEEIQE